MAEKKYEGEDLMRNSKGAAIACGCALTAALVVICLARTGQSQGIELPAGDGCSRTCIGFVDPSDVAYKIADVHDVLSLDPRRTKDPVAEAEGEEAKAKASAAALQVKLAKDVACLEFDPGEGTPGSFEVSVNYGTASAGAVGPTAFAHGRGIAGYIFKQVPRIKKDDMGNDVVANSPDDLVYMQTVNESGAALEAFVKGSEDTKSNLNHQLNCTCDDDEDQPRSSTAFAYIWGTSDSGVEQLVKKTEGKILNVLKDTGDAVIEFLAETFDLDDDTKKTLQDGFDELSDFSGLLDTEAKLSMELNLNGLTSEPATRTFMDVRMDKDVKPTSRTISRGQGFIRQRRYLKEDRNVSVTIKSANVKGKARAEGQRMSGVSIAASGWAFMEVQGCGFTDDTHTKRVLFGMATAANAGGDPGQLAGAGFTRDAGSLLDKRVILEIAADGKTKSGKMKIREYSDASDEAIAAMLTDFVANVIPQITANEEDMAVSAMQSINNRVVASLRPINQSEADAITPEPEPEE